MQFSDEDIKEFIDHWKKDFGETITPEFARHRAAQLVELALMLATRSPEHNSSTQEHKPDQPHSPKNS